MILANCLFALFVSVTIVSCQESDTIFGQRRPKGIEKPFSKRIGEVYRAPRGFLQPVRVIPIVPAVPVVKYVIKKEPKRGYVYTPPTTTTTTTTPEPAIEAEADNDSQFVSPSPPPPSVPERDFEESPAIVDDGPLDPWDIRDSVPGSPGDDYPVLGQIPKTSFTCEGRIPGYYADPETRCQVFHRCSDCTDNVRLQMDSFLCPNGTQFNQEILSCDWWGNVNCKTATKFYGINNELNKLGDDGKYVELPAMRVAPSLLDKKVAPGIIPKDERKRLPPQYRSQHSYDSTQQHSPQNNDKNSQNDEQRGKITFTEFNKAPADGITSALNNPDYFATSNENNDGNNNAQTNENNENNSQNSDNNEELGDPRTESDDESPKEESPTPEAKDDDYFGGEAEIETRANVDEESEGSKLDNDPLNPSKKEKKREKSTKATSVLTTTEKATTTTLSTTTSKKIKEEAKKDEIGLRSFIGFQRVPDSAEGFIVNRPKSNDQEPDPLNFDEELDGSKLDSEIRPPSTSDRIEQTDADDKKPNDEYLPPKNDEYLPPKNDVYLPPKKNEYLPPKKVDEPKPVYGPPAQKGIIYKEVPTLALHNLLAPQQIYYNSFPVNTFAPAPQAPVLNAPTFNYLSPGGAPVYASNYYQVQSPSLPQLFNSLNLNSGIFPISHGVANSFYL